MDFKKLLLAAAIPMLCVSCTSQGQFDSNKLITIGANVGTGVLQAGLLDENSVKETASLAAVEYDKKNQVAATNSAQHKRLMKLTQGLTQVGDTPLNFKVYINSEINAFAMADGTVRVHSGLLDAMPDDQVLAVIQHELGHVRLKHSYKQMKEQLLANTAFQSVASAGGTLGELTSSQLGQIAYTAVNAHFSQKDELEADEYSVNALKKMGKDPAAMLRAITTLKEKYGSGGGFLSSHPSNNTRLEKIQQAINKK